MYRHFAVVTLALTAAVAMFANGDNAHGVAQRVSTDRQANRSRPTHHAATLAGSPPPISGDDAADGAFGTPGEGRYARTTSGLAPFEALVAAGYSRAYLESLSPEDLQRLLEAVEGDGTPSADHKPEAAALGAASAARSGAPSASD